MPKVSVVIPTYNYARFLPAAIDSVLAQTYQDFEVIVIDDGSTDDTATAVAPYLNRIHYEWRENKGVSATRNRGIELAKGEYIAFLDADDEWLPGKLAAQMPLFSDREVALVYCDIKVRWSDGREDPSFLAGRSAASGWIFNSLLHHSYIMPSAAVARRGVILDVGGFDSAADTREDLDLWLRIAQRWKVAQTPEALAVRREHGANYIRQISDLSTRSAVYRYEKLLRIFSLEENQRRQVLRGLSKAHFLRGYYFSRAGQRRQARRSLLASLRLNWRHWPTWHCLGGTLLPAAIVARFRAR